MVLDIWSLLSKGISDFFGSIKEITLAHSNDIVFWTSLVIAGIVIFEIVYKMFNKE